MKLQKSCDAFMMSQLSRRCVTASYSTKKGCLSVYRLFLYEVKAGGSFLEGRQSRGFVITDHGSERTTAAGNETALFLRLAQFLR